MVELNEDIDIGWVRLPSSSGSEKPKMLDVECRELGRFNLELFDQLHAGRRKKGANPNVCGAFNKLVSICQAENSQKPKTESAFLTTDVTAITDVRRAGKYPRYPRNPW